MQQTRQASHGFGSAARVNWWIYGKTRRGAKALPATAETLYANADAVLLLVQGQQQTRRDSLERQAPSTSGALMKPLRSTAPRDSILNPNRPYTPAAQTDLAATFARVRERIAAEQSAQVVSVVGRKRRQRGAFNLFAAFVLAGIVALMITVILAVSLSEPARYRVASAEVADELRFQDAIAARTFR